MPRSARARAGAAIKLKYQAKHAAIGRRRQAVGWTQRPPDRVLCGRREGLQLLSPFLQGVADAVELGASVDERRHGATQARRQHRASTDKAEDRCARGLDHIVISVELLV